MKAVVQRVKSASVKIVQQNYFQQIDKGLLILLGIKSGDSIEDVNFVADVL
jgi:D-tyrosyl-tRNA(Tyr) deacylase